MRTRYRLSLILNPLIISLFLVGLASCGQELAAPLPPPPSAPEGPRLNVRDFGARGDGVADDTAAIQAAINAAPNSQNSTIYFPAGVYISNNFQVTGRSGLRFEGDGFNSIIKRPPYPGNTRPATFERSSDITIRNIAFDENGIERFGGVNFYSVRRVRIENTRHFDGNPSPIPTSNWVDHFSYIFAQGGAPSEDVTIQNNIIDRLDLQFVFARRVTVIGNRVTLGCCTSGIGVFSLSSNTIAEDFVIERNIVIDPRGSSNGIVVELDPPSTSNGSFRRIRIAHNTIIRRTTNGNGVLIGTPNNSVSTTGNVFEDITIEGNRFHHEPTAPPRPDDTANIMANNRAATTNILFHRIVIRGNEMTNPPYGMDLRFLQNSVVEGNRLWNAWLGIGVSSGQVNTRVSDNFVHVADRALPYFWAWSGRGNRFERNRYAGNASHPVQVIEPTSETVFEQPRLELSPPPIPPPPRP